MEVDFWGVKSNGCRNSHATEVKCSKIPHNRKRSEMNVKAAENPKFSGYRSSSPSRNDQSFFTIHMSLGVFRAKFPMEMKAAKLCYWRL
jgi:hypothetical protein